MRVRDHIAISSAGAALLYPWAGRKVLAAWAASILIDADHYFWFCLHERRLSPRAAIRFFNQPEDPRPAATRAFHHPVALAAVLALSARSRTALAVGLGMLLHVALDANHEVRMGAARAAALQRDSFICQSCGAQRGLITAHLKRQPRLLPEYRMENFVTLCAGCHRAAHEGRLRESMAGNVAVKAGSSTRTVAEAGR